MSVSVIIPTLNEAACIATAIESLRRQGPNEIIVADGGSSDGTPELASAADVVLRTSRGRAVQMNAGAARAQGDHLVFLHADCTLADGAIAAALKTLRRPGVVAGCFTMRVAAEGFAYRCIDAAAAARVRFTGIMYGDQGLYVRRDVFERLRGFPIVNFMEDVWFSRRLCRAGRIAMVAHKIFVGPRRWQRTGLVQQTLRNWSLIALALAGVQPDRLARFYPVVR